MEWFLFEQAVLEFVKYFPEETQRKPFFYHSIRVWVFCGISDTLKKYKLLDFYMIHLKIPVFQKIL